MSGSLQVVSLRVEAAHKEEQLAKTEREVIICRVRSLLRCAGLPITLTKLP